MEKLLIMLGLAAVEWFAKTAPKRVEAMRQRGEMTAEEAAAFKSQMAANRASEAYKTDAEAGR